MSFQCMVCHLYYEESDTEELPKGRLIPDLRGRRDDVLDAICHDCAVKRMKKGIKKVIIQHNQRTIHDFMEFIKERHYELAKTVQENYDEFVVERNNLFTNMQNQNATIQNTFYTELANQNERLGSVETNIVGPLEMRIKQLEEQVKYLSSVIICQSMISSDYVPEEK